MHCPKCQEPYIGANQKDIMFEWVLAAIGLVGFGLAGYWDLKSTEFPDWLPYSMIILALAVRSVFAWLSSDWGILSSSVLVGLAFLAVGLGLYFAKQWGDGDAWLLGALGFLFPNMPNASAAVSSGFAYSGVFPSPVGLLFNFFIVAFVYIIAYSVLLSFVKRGIWSGFARSFRRECKGAVMLVGGATAAYFVFLIAMFFCFGLVPPSPLLVASFPAIIAFIVVFSHYGMYIEKNLFKRRIPVSKLRAGDVPAGRHWRMLKPAEVKALKRRGGHIWIKEGVRFAPVFVITLVVTLLLGDLFSLVLGLI